MIIKEFLPNPVGPDKDGEYIKIFNDSDKAVNLAGWKASDASKKTFNLSGILDSKKELTLFSSQTKISLNNNGETIFLYDAKGELVDKLGYSGTAAEGKVIVNQKILGSKTTETKLVSGEVLNKSLLPSNGKIIFTDLFVALILGLIAIYVILQLEKRFDIKLF